MPLPRAMAEALKAVAPQRLPGVLTATLVCQGARFHSPTPLLVHEAELANGRTVHLCGTCRDNAAVLSALLREHSNELTWPVRREFGNQLRSLLIPRETDADG